MFARVAIFTFVGPISCLISEVEKVCSAGFCIVSSLLIFMMIKSSSFLTRSTENRIHSDTFLTVC